MMYSKEYLKEKLESINHDMNILLAHPEDDYVEFPEGRGIRENLNDRWEAIRRELGL